MHNTVSATLDFNNLHHNYRLLKDLAPGANVFAVVKSDAYGHGLLSIAKGLPEADGFALIELDDAIALRQAGVAQPVLLLAGVNGAEELAAARAHRLDVVVHHRDHLALLQADAAGQPLRIWVKVNGSMNRFGFAAADTAAIVRALQASPGVQLAGLMMHFAAADRLDQPLEAQWRDFRALCALTQLPFSAANSAAALRDAGTHGALVRAGAALYGINPFSGPDRFGLRPVMRLSARLIGVSELAPGQAVGYDGRFVAERAMRVGVVGCGYGNGYPAAAPTGTPVAICGVRTRSVGKVAMNVMFIDLEPVPGARVGDWVTLWGDDLVRIEEVASRAGVSAASIDCSMAKKQVMARNN